MFFERIQKGLAMPGHCVCAVCCKGAALAWIVCSPLQAADPPAKITYDDHVKAIFREHCTSCHNSNDKKSGLALDSYQGVMAGGSGGDVVAAGKLDSSRLYALASHQEQPFMPPNQDKIAQSKLDLIKTWIEQGLPENSGSAILKPTASAAALQVASTERPTGPLPMPITLTKQTPVYTRRAATISALAASPWSPLIAVGGQKQVTLYHSENGQLLGILPFPEGEPQSITFSRDGRLMLVGGGRHSAFGCAVLYDVATGKRIASVGDELDIALSADISDDNQLIALGGPQRIVRVFETMTGKLKFEHKKHTDWVCSVRYSPDGLLLATGDRSSGLVVWEAQTGRLFQELPGHKAEIRSIAWRPDSQGLYSSSLDGTIKSWDMNEGKLIKSWDAHPGGVTAIAICNTGMIVSTGRDNKVKVWESNGNAAGEMPALVEAGHEVAITADAMQLAAGDWAGNVRLWPRAKPADEHKLAANPQPLELQLEAALRTLDEQRAMLAQAQAELAVAEGRYATAKEAMTVAYSISQPVTEEMVCESNECAAIFSYTTKALIKSRAKSDVAKTKVEATEKLIADLKIDIDKFQHFPEELAAQINTLEQSIATQTTKLAPAEELVAAATTRREAVNAEIANLETQLAALQAKIQAERAKRTVLDTDVIKHQQEVDELRAQIQQSDSELVQIKGQRELYQKVFGK